MGQQTYKTKKIKLAKKGRQTKWAPVWAVFEKILEWVKELHPSTMTKNRRSWRRTKLHIKPRKIRKSHFG